MTKIREYLAYLIQEATQARIAADSYAVEVAKSYSQDKLLRHLSAPRFTLPEIELDIPVFIQDSEHQMNFKLKSDAHALSKRIHPIVQNVIKVSGIDKSITASKISETPSFKFAINTLTENKQQVHSKSKLMDQFNWTSLVNGILKDALSVPIFKKIKPNIIPVAVKEFVVVFDEELIIDQSKFLDAQASFRTDDIKKVDDAGKIFKIKLKLVDESINHVSVKNEDGGEDEILVL